MSTRWRQSYCHEDLDSEAFFQVEKKTKNDFDHLNIADTFFWVFFFYKGAHTELKLETSISLAKKKKQKETKQGACVVPSAGVESPSKWDGMSFCFFSIFFFFQPLDCAQVKIWEKAG